MLYTELDFRVKESKKVIQVGLNVSNLGSLVAYIDNTEEDAFTQFVLGVESAKERFVLLTARIVVPGNTVGISTYDMCVRAQDISFIQHLGIEEDL